MTPSGRAAVMACVLRADDAVRVRPVCGDTFAAHLIDDELRGRVRAAGDTGNASASIVVRHRLIDDALRRLLETDANRRVILLNGGFDTRAFRLNGGRWWEFDSPEILAFKEQRLPASDAPNPVARISVEPSDGQESYPFPDLAGDDEPVVVMEGMSMYLPSPALAATAAAIRTHLPKAIVICDVMTPAFRRRFSSSLRGQSEGSRESGNAGPREVIEAAGFAPVAHESVVGRAHREGLVRVPGWLLATFLRELRDGYQVWMFRAG